MTPSLENLRLIASSTFEGTSIRTVKTWASATGAKLSPGSPIKFKIGGITVPEVGSSQAAILSIIGPDSAKIAEAEVMFPQVQTSLEAQTDLGATTKALLSLVSPQSRR